MIEKDLFYYVFSNDEKKYNEILGLIEANEDLENEITDGQKVFLRDFYFRLLFRIAILSYRGYSDEEIVKLLNINTDINVINLDNLASLKVKYNNVLNKFYEFLNEIYKNVTTNYCTSV